jgi:hypothetical protein
VRVAVVALSLLGSVLLAPPAQAAACRTDVFPASYAQRLASDYPSQRVTASVYDTRTGCWYHLNRSLRLTTASVIKGGILGATLLRAQDRGRRLTTSERNLAGPMIRLSHNPPTSTLFSNIGGVTAMNAFDRRVGATETRNTSQWGATLTSARDRTLVSLRMLHGGGSLQAAARSDAWAYMTNVNPTQRWGINAGVTIGMETALKNGFYPMSGNGWRVGSTGFVRNRQTKAGYVVTILTDRGSDQHVGIRLVERVARQVAYRLADAGSIAARPVDRAVCTKTRSGESWGTVAMRLGLSSSRGPDVRWVSGGNPSPLQGQRACSPDLRP